MSKKTSTKKAPAKATKKATQKPADAAKGKKVGKAKAAEARATESQPVEVANAAEANADRPITDAKSAKTRKKREPKADGKLSAIDAAAKVLGEAGEPMNAKQMIEAMAEKGYWTSPGGKTPAATLFSALLREIDKKGTSPGS